LTETVTHLILQLAVILLAAKLAGEVCWRWLKIPPLIGELVAGIIIGPFALGGLSIPGYGPLFEKPLTVAAETAAFPVSTQLWSVAQIAAIVLLFAAGLETDAGLFLRYAGQASIVAVGGVVFSFFFGAYATILLGFAKGLTDPVALFMGAILTATSVGITARVLSEKKKLDTPEGVTILGAAVIDDVLGILVLTIVVGIAANGQVSASQVGIVGGKAIGFWLGLTGLGFLLSKALSRFLLSFKVTGAALALGLALAFLASALAEKAGLAMIIGAYSIGLALSGTKLAKAIDEPLQAVYQALVPVFFVVMGMLVDISAMGSAVVFGVVSTILAIASKVLGAGLPSLAVGFNLRGGWRIGLGMLPRGEVALIVAGVGLSKGIIGADIFGVAIMVTVVTTVLAPIILGPAFAGGGPGTRPRAGTTGKSPTPETTERGAHGK